VQGKLVVDFILLAGHSDAKRKSRRRRVLRDDGKSFQILNENSQAFDLI
jgi:hypothetical protein